MSFISRLELRDSAEAKRRLRIGITESCNLRCFFCHGDGGKVYHFASRESICSPSEVAQAIEVAADCGIQKVKITGGEPLLYSHSGANIVDVVERSSRVAERVGVDLSMVSNGILISRQRASELWDAGLRNITISLHGGSAETFSAYAHPLDSGQFSLVLKGIENAVASGMQVKLNSVVFYSREKSGLRNVAEIEDILRIGRDLGVREVKFLVVVENPRFFGEKFQDTYIYWDDPVLSDCFPKEVLSLIRGTLGDPMLSELAFPGTFKAIFSLGAQVESLPTFSFQNMRLRSKADGVSVDCGCQEGSYAVRLLANGQLKSCLWDSRELNILPSLRAGDLGRARSLFREAIEAVHKSAGEIIFSYK